MSQGHRERKGGRSCRAKGVGFHPSCNRKSEQSFKALFWGGTWVAQLLKPLTLGFGLGHDLTVPELEPQVRLCVDSSEPAWDSLSLPLPSPFFLSLSLSK